MGLYIFKSDLTTSFTASHWFILCKQPGSKAKLMSALFLSSKFGDVYIFLSHFTR